MSAIIRNGVLLLGVALLPSLVAQAQQKSASTYTTDVDVAITYVAERAKVASVDCGCFWLNGGSGDFSITLFHGMGVAADLTGVPSGAIATIGPAAWTQLTSTTWSFPANSALPATTLSIKTPSAIARLEPGTQLHRTLPPVALGLLLLPLAGMRRRLGKTLGRTIFTLFLLLAGASAMAGLSGCGTNSGFFGQPETTYNVQITATSGSLSHSTSVTLTVQ